MTNIKYSPIDIFLLEGAYAKGVDEASRPKCAIPAEIDGRVVDGIQI